MKSITLTRDQYTRWNANRVILCNKFGEPVRPMTADEQKRYSEATKKGVKVGLKDPDGNILIPTQDRDLIKKELTDVHGDCIARVRGGRRIIPIRCRPIAGREVVATAPSTDPDHCKCSTWQGRQPGRHHRICSENHNAPPEQRGDLAFKDPVNTDVPTIEASTDVSELAEPAPVEPNTTFVALDSPETKTTIVELPKPAIEIPEPEVCQCAPWGKAPEYEKNHHPICEFFEPWNKARMKGKPILKTLKGETVRDASVGEWCQAMNAQESTGVPSIVINEVQYLVVVEE